MVPVPPLYRTPLLWSGVLMILFSLSAWRATLHREHITVLARGAWGSLAIGSKEGRGILRHFHVEKGHPPPDANDWSAPAPEPKASDIFHIQTFHWVHSRPSYTRIYSSPWWFVILLQLALWSALIYWRHRRIKKAAALIPST